MLTPFRQSLRVLLRYRLYTGFALIGLSVAITSVWYIANYVKHAYTHDAFHDHGDRIYRLSMEVTAGGQTDHYATTGKPLGELMQKEYTGVEAYARLKFHPSTIHLNGEAFKETGFFQANPQTLSVFSFDFISGGQRSLSQPDAIVLAKSLAIKYFGEVNIVGEQLSIGEQTYRISGVFEDWPRNSHIRVNALISGAVDSAYDVQSWFDLEQYTYALVKPNLQKQDLQEKLDQLAVDQLAPQIEGSGVAVRFRAQPLREVHFASGLVDDVQKGSLLYTNALAIAGLLILLIATFNFINLTLTRSTQRTKEIRVKKVFGISRHQLVGQSVSESLAMTLLVLLFSVVLIFFGEKFYTAYTDYEAPSLTGNIPLLLFLALLIFISGLLGSTYSGVYLSFSTPSVMQESPRVLFFKKMLLGFQYTIAVVVLILALTMGRQLNFLLTKDLGFDQEQVLALSLPEIEQERGKALTFRDQLSSMGLTSIIGWGALPGEENGKDLFEVQETGTRTEKVYNIYRIDEQYFEVLDIELAQGRNFDPEKRNDEAGSVIINEALARSLYWDKPLGEEIWYGGERKVVIGVVKDFHNKSLHNLIEPIVFLFDTQQPHTLLIKAPSSELTSLQSAWDNFYAGTPFAVTHFDQYIGAMYHKEKQLSQLFYFFSLIALSLCYMGLFALFSLQVQQRTKEISIRKVLGAEVHNLFSAIIKNYGQVIILSLAVALPLAWHLVRRWLGAFSFSTQVGIEVYLFAGIIVVFTSLLMIAYHLSKILWVNPAVALKHE